MGYKSIWMALVLTTLLAATVSADLTNPDLSIFGYVTINGAPAPENTEVKVYVEGSLSDTTQTGIGDDEDDYYRSDIYLNSGENVSFKVNEVNAQESFIWPGMPPVKYQNLTVTIASTCSEYITSTDCEDNGCYWCSECENSRIFVAPRCVDSSEECNYNGCDFTCGADCEDDGDCPDNECSEIYNDYCDGNKLVEYDSDKIQDSTNVTDACGNTCEASCTCSDCDVDCSAPATNTYCVEDVCGAECGFGDTDQQQCGVTDVGACEYGTQTRSCDTSTCSWGSWGSCEGNTDPVTEDCDDGVDNDCDGSTDCEDSDCDTDPTCTECQTDSDCNYLDQDYCEEDLVKHDEGRCIDYVCQVETTTTYNCSTDDTTYCDSDEVVTEEYTCSGAACELEVYETQDCYFRNEYCAGDEVQADQGYCD